MLVLTLVGVSGDEIGSKETPYEFASQKACEDNIPSKVAALRNEFPNL